MNKQKTIFAGLLILLIVSLSFFLLQNHLNQSETLIGGEHSQPTQEIKGFQGAGAHISVHIEPLSDTEDALTRWETMSQLVELADSYGMKLSLHFSASPANFVLQSSIRLATLRKWEANGHEIAFHHHGQSHASWDGYSNDPKARFESEYKGTIEDLLETVSALPKGGVILSGSGTDEDTDWPTGVIYMTNGGSPPSSDYLISKIDTVSYNDQEILFLTKAPFGVDKGFESTSVEFIEEHLTLIEQNEYIGLAFSDTDIGKYFDDVENLFKLYQEHDIVTSTLDSLLGE